MSWSRRLLYTQKIYSPVRCKDNPCRRAKSWPALICLWLANACCLYWIVMVNPLLAQTTLPFSYLFCPWLILISSTISQVVKKSGESARVQGFIHQSDTCLPDNRVQVKVFYQAGFLTYSSLVTSKVTYNNISEHFHGGCLTSISWTSLHSMKERGQSWLTGVNYHKEAMKKNKKQIKLFCL